MRSDTEESKLHAFYDSNQSVYGKVASELASFALLPIHLSRNLRNTKVIHHAASQFYEGLPLRPDGPDGVSVDFMVCEESAVNSEICRCVHRLIKQQAVSPSDIVVITPSHASLLNIRAELDNLAKNITSDTVMRFKGLESSG